MGVIVGVRVRSERRATMVLDRMAKSKGERCENPTNLLKTRNLSLSLPLATSDFGKGERDIRAALGGRAMNYRRGDDNAKEGSATRATRHACASSSSGNPCFLKRSKRQLGTPTVGQISACGLRIEACIGFPAPSDTSFDGKSNAWAHPRRPNK